MVAVNINDLHVEPASDEALLKIDFRNAFNLIDRDAFVQAASRDFPGMLWTATDPRACCFMTTIVSFNPLPARRSAGPTLFLLWYRWARRKDSEVWASIQQWYMDDGGIIAPTGKLVAIWNMLLEESQKLGLELNPAKCEWSWLNPDCTQPCPIRSWQ